MRRRSRSTPRWSRPRSPSSSATGVTASTQTPSPSVTGERAVHPGAHGALGGSAVIRSAPGAAPRCNCAYNGSGRAGASSEHPYPRIFLVEDHAMFRAGVKAELGQAVEVVGEADEADAAIELIDERLPDVVLLDVHLPGGGGRAVLGGVPPAPSRGPVPRPVGLRRTRGRDRRDPGRRRGSVTKTISGPELLQAVCRVAAGDAVFSPRLAGFVLDAFTGAGAAPAQPLDAELDQLSPREARGPASHRPRLHLQEVARDLGISARTVETHVSSVLRKLQSPPATSSPDGLPTGDWSRMVSDGGHAWGPDRRAPRHGPSRGRRRGRRSMELRAGSAGPARPGRGGDRLAHGSW